MDAGKASLKKLYTFYQVENYTYNLAGFISD